jgi:hypothetical protein
MITLEELKDLATSSTIDDSGETYFAYLDRKGYNNKNVVWPWNVVDSSLPQDEHEELDDIYDNLEKLLKRRDEILGKNKIKNAAHAKKYFKRLYSNGLLGTLPVLNEDKELEFRPDLAITKIDDIVVGAAFGSFAVTDLHGADIEDVLGNPFEAKLLINNQKHNDISPNGLVMRGGKNVENAGLHTKHKYTDVSSEDIHNKDVMVLCVDAESGRVVEKVVTPAKYVKECHMTHKNKTNSRSAQKTCLINLVDHRMYGTQLYPDIKFYDYLNETKIRKAFKVWQTRTKRPGALDFVEYMPYVDWPAHNMCKYYDSNRERLDEWLKTVV